MKSFLRLARRYWFDALVLLGLGVGLAGTVLSQGEKDGPTGPLWFDVLALVAIVTPLFARRRFPFGAPLTVGVAVVLTSFVDERLVPLVFIPFLAGCAALFLVGLLRERVQAVASSCLPSGSRRLSPTGIPWEHSAPHPDGHRLRHRLDDRIRARPQVPGSGRGERAGCPGRAGAGGTGTLRGERGARADRARIARFRRPQRQRHDGAGLRGAQAASARAGARARGSPCRRADGTRGAGGDAEEAPALAPQPTLEHLDKLVEQGRPNRPVVCMSHCATRFRVAASVGFGRFYVVKAIVEISRRRR